MNIRNYINELTAEIDSAREDIWDTKHLESVRSPADVFAAAHARQSKRAELWDNIMQYREGYIEEEDLFMFMQSFDRKLTYYDFIKVMENIKHV